ncbi:MAG: dethiobiotin synthase [Holosporales bacterium]|jgi:dethiobiotin synthase|nr:dethiobiotin synthase [Holosporales bacterium]
MNIFVTGTSTNVGKTVVSAWICLHTKASYWKPIQTGSEIDSDKKVMEVLSPKTKRVDEVYLLKAPLSPYDAAKFEDIDIDVKKILSKTPERTVIEGAGGICVPIQENFQMLDLAALSNSHTLVVAKSELGMLNHLFMTIDALARRSISIIGVVLIGNTENFLIKTIEKFTKVRVLQILPVVENVKRMIDTTPLPNEIYRTFQ